MIDDDAAAELLRGYSVEMTARNRHGVRLARTHLAPGTEIYLASIHGDSHHTLATAATSLSDAGYIPVPHISARSLSGYTQLHDLLARLHDHGVTRALVIGGDADQAAGPYHSAYELLRTGLFERHGMQRIGVACHPEPHRKVSSAELDRALLDKLALIAEQGMQGWLVSQFCFDAPAIVRRAQQIRAMGITAPLRIGIAGPADQHTLWKFALHCGIGNSIRALGTHTEIIANLLMRKAPDALLRGLARTVDNDPALGVEGIHIFTFGGVAPASRWAQGVLRQSELVLPALA